MQKDVQENVLSLKQIVFIRKLSKTEYEKQEQEKKKHIETFLEKKKKEDEALVDWENLKVSLTKTRDSLFIKERREKIRKLLKTKKYVSRQFLVDMFTFYDSIFFNNQLRKKCKNQNVKIDFEESEKVSNKCVRFGLKKQKDDFKRALFTLYKENTNKLLTSETSLMPNEFYICCNVQCQTPLKSLMVMFEHELVELFVFAFNISSETANKMRVLFFGHSL